MLLLEDQKVIKAMYTCLQRTTKFRTDPNLDGVVCEEGDHPRRSLGVCRQEYHCYQGKAL